MKAFAPLFVLVLFTSTLFAQGNEALYERLNALTKVIQRWQAAEYREVTPDSILQQLAMDSLRSPVLSRLLADAAARYQNGLMLVEEHKQKAVVVPAITIAAEYKVNKKNAGKKYNQMTMNVEGVISSLAEDSDGNTVIVLAPNIRCIVLSENTGELAFIESGTTHTFAGKVRGIVTTNKTDEIVMDNCRIVRPIDIEEEKGLVVNQLFSVVDDYKAQLPGEIVRVRTAIVDGFYRAGTQLYQEKLYDSAKTVLNKILTYVSDYKDLRALLGTVSLSALYDHADTLYQQGKYREAYTEFFHLGYKLKFNDAAERFKQSFKQYYSNIISDSKKTNTISEYTAVFDTLLKYIKADKPFCDELFDEWHPDFTAYAQKHYRRDIKKYILIPGGTYLKPRSRSKFQVASFLIYPVQIDNTFLRAYYLSRSASLPSEFPEILPAGYQDEQKLGIGNWLGLHVMRDDQREYIRLDGWPSETEKLRYNPKWQNFDVDPSHIYCITLDELRYKDDYANLLKMAEERKAEMNARINSEKEEQISTGKIVVYKRVLVSPLAGANVSFDIWEFPDTSVHPPVQQNAARKTLRQYIMRYDFFGGVFLGWNAQKKMFKNEQMFHGPGIEIRYLSSWKQSHAVLLGAKGNNELEIGTFKLSGIGAELQYRPAGESTNGVLGVGIMMLNSEYLLTYQKGTASETVYRHSGSIPALSVTLGLGFKTFPYMRTQIFARSFVSLGEKGQFKWMDETLAGNVMAGLSFEVPLLFWRYEDL